MIETSAVIESLLAKPLHAVVGVNRPGKPPQLSVVWFEWDGATFRFSTTRTRAKYRNLLRDAQVSLLVDDPATNSYVVAYGKAVAEHGGHADLSGRLFQRYLPQRVPDSEPEDPNRVVIALVPDRILIGS